MIYYASQPFIVRFFRITSISALLLLVLQECSLLIQINQIYQITENVSYRAYADDVSIFILAKNTENLQIECEKLRSKVSLFFNSNTLLFNAKNLKLFKLHNF